MRKTIIASFLFASVALAADNPVDRWASAAGGRAKVAAIKSIYREGTLRFGPYEGTIKVWHTADGKYRKEEQVGAFSSVETFDGTEGVVRKGAAPPVKVEGPALVVARSKSFANSNAMFFVFFPERRRGTVAVEDDNTIVFTPEGGIAWRVTLDPQTSLPKSMSHSEGGKTITVTFTAYETVDGVTLEKELHRGMGGQGFDTDIRFTKTVINAPVEASMFSMEQKAPAK